MPAAEEIFIVRVRPREGDAVVEQPRLDRRRAIRDLADVGLLIRRWVDRSSPPTAGQPTTGPKEDR